MARLATVDSYTYDGNTVEYSDYFSNNTTFPLNRRLKDDYFLFHCHEKYARKKAKIYQGAYGDVNPVSGSQPEEILNTVTIENTTARFMPLFAPTNSTGQAFFEWWEYEQSEINWEILLNHDVRFTNFGMGSFKWGMEYTDKGSYWQRFTALTKWNVKKFLVLPLVVGVYVGGASQGREIWHIHPTALDDFLAAPDTEIPPTDGSYTRIGYSYCYKVIYVGHNYSNAGMPMMLDCGFEINEDEFNSIMGGYGQLAGWYSYTLFSTTLIDHKIYTPFNSANNLLGLCAYVTGTRGSTSDNIDYIGLAQPINRVRNTNYNFGREAEIFQISVVGDLDYLEFTETAYGIGQDYSGNHQIKIPIPIIKNEYITNRDFLINVACQMGLPIITDRATALSFSLLNDNNYLQWWETNASKIIIPNIDMDTAEVKAGATPYSELPEDDKRREYLNSENPLDTIPIMNTSDIDTNTYTEETPLNNPTITAAGKFNRYYALSQHDIEDLVEFLYTNNQSTISDILDGLKLNGENPMNFLISLKMFPFDLTEYGDYTTEVIGFGNGVSTGITAEKLNDFTAILDLGSCTFRAYNGNFYDYEPYTTAKLYIPYCGEITVSTAQCVGHTISVKMIVDIITGSCCAVVFCDEIAIAYSNGNMSVEIPITGENATEYVSRGMSDLTNIASSTADLVTGGLSLNAVEQGLKSAYDFNNMPTPLQTNGTSTAQTNFFKPQNCYFVVQSPVLLPTSGYGSHIGFACEYTAQLDDVSGFTVCANVNNITPTQATEKEIDMIKNLLETGVIL